MIWERNFCEFLLPVQGDPSAVARVSPMLGTVEVADKGGKLIPPHPVQI